MTKYHISKPTLILSIIVLFLSVQVIQSQNSKSDAVVGTWLFNPELSFTKIDKKANDQLNKNPQLRSRILSSYTGKQITFFSNGDYSQVLASGKKAVGKWQANDNSLVILDTQGTKYSYTYSISGNRLVLSTINKTANIASVITDQYFTKLKN